MACSSQAFLVPHDCQELSIGSHSIWPTALEYQKLQDIMPLNAMWHPLDEQHLEWDERELSIYLDHTSDQRILQPDDKLPQLSTRGDM